MCFLRKRAWYLLRALYPERSPNKKRPRSPGPIKILTITKAPLRGHTDEQRKNNEKESLIVLACVYLCVPTMSGPVVHRLLRRGLRRLNKLREAFS